MYTLRQWSVEDYQKASGKPLALAMGMNTVVALATLNKFIAKKLSLFYHSRQKIDRNYEKKSSPTENLLVYLTGRINDKILAIFEV